MMKLPRLNSDDDASESLIMYLTDPARLQLYESWAPGCTKGLLEEAKKQIGHKRMRFWARFSARFLAWIVGLLFGLAAMNKVPAELLHALIAAF
jgi:hypothetical protein